MRPFRSLVSGLFVLLLSVAVTGCFGGGAKAPTGGTSLTGTLRNEYGHPVGRATLKVGGVTATTGSDGAFRLSGIQSGSQTVVFRAKGYLDRDLTVTIKAGQANRLTEPGSGGPVILKTVHSATGSLAGLGVTTPVAAKAAKAPQSMKGAQSMQVAQTIQAMEAHTAACDTCHSVTDGVGTKFLDANSQSLCTQSGCHATAAEGGTFEHPAAHLDNALIQPTGELAEYDQIGCLGCHVSHAETPGGSLTPGLPGTVTNTSYTAYCTSCHNGSQPGNTFDPTTHYGTDCTTSCHELSGVANGHKSCNRQGTGCHALSSTLALSPTHRLGTTPCANCHDTEGGPSENKLLKNGGDDALCLTGCHNPKHDRIEQELITASQRSADPAAVDEYVHNVPCQACHNVHTMGAAPGNLITHPFEKTPWNYPRLPGNAPYDATTLAGYETDYYFCFSCHGAYKNGNYTMYDGTVKNDSRNAERQAWGADWVARGAKEVYWNYTVLSKPAKTNFAMPGTPYNVDMHPSHFSIRFEHPAGSEPISCESCHGVHTSIQKSLVQNPLAPFVNPPDTYGDVPMHNCIQATSYLSCHSSNCHTAAFWP